MTNAKLKKAYNTHYIWGSGEYVVASDSLPPETTVYRLESLEKAKSLITYLFSHDYATWAQLYFPDRPKPIKVHAYEYKRQGLQIPEEDREVLAGAGLDSTHSTTPEQNRDEA